MALLTRQTPDFVLAFWAGGASSERVGVSPISGAWRRPLRYQPKSVSARPGRKALRMSIDVWR